MEGFRHCCGHWQLVMMESCYLVLAGIARQAGQGAMICKYLGPPPPPNLGSLGFWGAIGWGCDHPHFRCIERHGDAIVHAGELFAKLLISLSHVHWLRCKYVNTVRFSDFFCLRAWAYNVCSAQLSRGHVSQTAWAVTWKLASLCSA